MLRDVRIEMLFAPYGHHERGSKDIFAHTLWRLLVEDVHFVFHGPPE
jgi:hypothetical protein